MPENNEEEIRSLYLGMIDAWNRRDAKGFASLVAEDGSGVGFDGTMLDGRDVIEKSFAQVFANHQTPPYVPIIRWVHFYNEDVAFLRAVAGMAPPGKEELDPALNAVQTLVAVKSGHSWKAASFQTTPAAFHGRPEEVEALTKDLEAARRAGA